MEYLDADRRQEGTPVTVTTQGQQEMVGNVTPDFFRLKIDFVDEFSNGEQEKEREWSQLQLQHWKVYLFCCSVLVGN